jgi:hypothetical protein
LLFREAFGGLGGWKGKESLRVMAFIRYLMFALQGQTL